jgi:hypothetical protein
VLHRLEMRYRVKDIGHEKYLRQEKEQRTRTGASPVGSRGAVGVLGFTAIPNPTLRDALIRSRGPSGGGDGGRITESGDGTIAPPADDVVSPNPARSGSVL